MNERLPSPQVVNGTQRQRASGVANRGRSPASTPASKTRNLRPFDRAVVKGGHREVYERIFETLAGMVNPHSHGVVVVNEQTLAFESKDRFPEYDRPTIGEIRDAMIYLRHAGRLERLRRSVNDPEGLFRVRILGEPSNAA